MVRIFTRRKERSAAAATSFLAIVSVFLMLNTVLGETQWGTCLEKKKDIPSRIGKQIKHITLEMSPRITHQLYTHIFRIILQEELGYTRVNIIETGDYNAKTILPRMNCFNFSGESTEEIIPEIMMNLEVPIPPDSDLLLADDECVKDMGSIGPSGSFGWFIPAQLGTAIKKYDPSWVNNSLDIHWREFRNQKYVKPFELTDKDLVMYIEKYMMDTKKKYFCNEPPCVNGWYIPDRCKSNPCALLLAPDFSSTKVVIEHINKMEVFVKVAWVGSNLRTVADTVRQAYVKQLKTKTYKSFMILSWTPSDVIADVREFIKVTLQPCDSTNDCFYDKRRSVKVAWNDLKGDYSYEVLKSMTFLDDHLYDNLFDAYLRHRDTSTIPEIACRWLKASDSILRTWLPKNYKVIHIGGIFPLSGSGYTGRGIVKGATMAKDAINANGTILPGYQIDVLVADSQCRADKVMKAFIDYLTGDMYKSMVGVLGPACSDTVEPLAGLSKYYKTITISYSAEGAFISDRDKYPYFMRTIGENKNYKYVYLELLRKLGWKRVAALTEDGQKYTEYISHMQDMLEAHDVTFISNTKFPRDREKDAMARYLEDLKRKRARIIIADVFDEIARNVMCEAYKLGMTAKQGYVWFLPTWLNSTWYNTTYYNHHLNESVNCTTANMIEAINGYFAMTHAFFGNDDDMMQENITIKQWREKYDNYTAGVTSNYAGYAYDAVWTYALALDTLLKEDPNAVSNLHSTNATNKLTQIIKSIDFNGVSGRIKFRGGTSRFSIINIVQWYNNDTRVIGRYFPNISDSAPEILGGHLELNESAIVWLGHKIPDDGTPPPVECTLNALAKFLNVKCEMAIIILNVVVISILIVSLVSILIIIKVRYDRKVKNTKQYMKSLGLQHLLKVSNDYSGLDKWEVEREVIVLNRKLGEGAFGTVYGGEGELPNYGWCAIAVKTLKIGSSTEEKLDFLSEAEVMKRFDHKNIVKLLGVCTKLEPVYTIMEFMLYGDLKTYLLARRHLVNANTEDAEEVSSKKLTSMALDVARGLSYLAEMKYVHRDIASRNCLLNGQRIVKLGDFGMTRPMFENDYYKFNRRGMLPVRWMAPESLALGLFTPASDMWSYGVLLFEIITFGSFPFQGLTNTQVLDYVKNGNIVTIPQGVKAPLECLLKTCWNQDSKLRPTASEIVEYLANNSRLISPCLEVPAQSVQMEDTGQLEMQLSGQFRKCSSSLSFKNGLVNGISSMSIPSPARRKHSMQGDSGVSLQMENCCPKEPLLPTRSDSISGCSKYTQHANADSGYQDHDEITDFYPPSANNGHAISKV